jgi:phage terminase large subunit-like protein
LQLAELQQKKRKLESYSPYTKQKLFHKLGASKRERLLRAGNQQGKSFSSCAESAIHATGRYPNWWEGKVFEENTVGWAGGVTGEVTRDTLQRLLIGAVGERGTGLIPEKDILEVIPARGVADLADTIIVKHHKKGKSRIRLKYYEQGRQKWQADTVHWINFDEEPPEDIYMEGLTRTNATGGLVWLAFTPLLGMSNVVHRFLSDSQQDRADINMTIDDAEHIPKEQRDKIIASYPAHEREARVNGAPILGSGLIFPVSDAFICCDSIPIPSHWPQINGIDFGWDHPTAAANLAWDRESDRVYVTKVYRVSEQTPLIHAAALKPWGDWIPVAWPHDGLQHDKGSGETLADQYRAQGLNMLSERATFEGGESGVEAGIMEMLQRMQTGRFKVFRSCTEFFEERRMYHRKDGKIVKARDDIISAVRYAIMMLREAITKPQPETNQPSYFNNGPNSWMGR